MTEENAPQKSPIATGAPSTSSLPDASEPESSAAYIAAGEKTADPVTPPPKRRGSGAGPGVLVLVILAALVGALVSLYVVRASPWLAQKILKEQQAQLLDAAGGSAEDKADSTEKAEGGSSPALPAASPAEVSGAAGAGNRPEPATVTGPRLDPLVSQRIAQMQQWSVFLRAQRAGPRDPSAALNTILSAGRAPPEVPAASDTPVTIVPGVPAAATLAPDNSAGPQAASEMPAVVNPFGDRVGAWFHGALDATGRFLASLVRIQQVSDPDLAGQSLVFFAQVDQRVQSHLLSARLLLMQEQPRLAADELAALAELLTRYYDPSDIRLTSLKDEVSALSAALKEPA